MEEKGSKIEDIAMTGIDHRLRRGQVDKNECAFVADLEIHPPEPEEDAFLYRVRASQGDIWSQIRCKSCRPVRDGEGVTYIGPAV